MSPRRASSLRRRRNSSEVPSSPPTPGNPRLVPLKRAVAIRRRVARDGGAFVLTNGVFDLLHPGHASFLEAARRLAGRKGKLFVALNSDQSTRRLKGPRRPIMDEGSRAYTLAQLRSVDGVVIFRGKRLRGLFAVVPFERRRAVGLFAGRDRFGKNIALDKGLHGAELNCHFPVDVEGDAERCHQQDEKPDCYSLKCHRFPRAFSKSKI